MAWGCVGEQRGRDPRRRWNGSERAGWRVVSAAAIDHRGARVRSNVSRTSRNTRRSRLARHGRRGCGRPPPYLLQFVVKLQRDAHHGRGPRRRRQDDADHGPRRPPERHGPARTGRRRALRADPRRSSPTHTLHIDPRAEALLYAAARAQLVAERLQPLLQHRRDRPPRPLRGLLARLPGRRPRARHRRDPQPQRVRHGRHQARPHDPAAHRPAARASPASPAARPTASRAPATSSSSESREPTTSSPPPSRTASSSSTRPNRRRRSSTAPSERFSSRPGAPGTTPRRRAPCPPATAPASSRGSRGARALDATSRGGSPARRPSSTTGISRPVTRARRVDHLAHRVTALAAEVVDVVAAGHGLLQRQDVRAPEVLDVDVVADRGAVRRRIVGAEDRHGLALARRGLQHERDQVRLGVVVLARARRSRPRR